MRTTIIRCCLFWLFVVVSIVGRAGDSTKLYNPSADAAKEITALRIKAKAESKRLLLQIGGNWCVMCYRLNAFIQTDSILKKLAVENYIVYHLNYSSENKNLAYLKSIGSPQRFGFPVLVILDSNGARLHTQETGALQKGNGYSFEKVKAFLEQWKPGVGNQLFQKPM